MANKGSTIRELVFEIKSTGVSTLYELGEKHIELFCIVLNHSKNIEICNVCKLIKNDDLFGSWSVDQTVKVCQNFASVSEIMTKSYVFYSFVLESKAELYPKLNWQQRKIRYDFNKLDELCIKKIFDSISRSHKKSAYILSRCNNSLYLSLKEIEDFYKKSSIYSYLGFKLVKRKNECKALKIQKLIITCNKKISKKNLKSKMNNFKTTHQRIIFSILRLKNLTEFNKDITDYAESKYNAFEMTLDDVETMLKVLEVRNYDDLKNDFPSLENLIDRKNWLPVLFPENFKKD